MFNLNISARLLRGRLSSLPLPSWCILSLLVKRETAEAIKRLLGERDTTPGATRGKGGSRWAIVRCDSVTPIGAGAGNIKEQLYPATIVATAADITYPALGTLDYEMLGLSVLMTLLTTDVVSVAPKLGGVYGGVLTGDVAIDKAGSLEGRPRVVCPMGYVQTVITGTGTDNHIVRWDGTANVQDSSNVIDDSGNLTTANVTATTITLKGAPSLPTVKVDSSAALLSGGTGPQALFTPGLGAAWEVGVVPAATLGGISNLKIGGVSSTLEMFTDAGPESRLEFKTAGSYNWSNLKTGNVSTNGIWGFGTNGYVGFWLHDTGPTSQRSVAIQGTATGDMHVRVAGVAGAGHAILVDEFGIAAPTYSIVHSAVQYDGVTGNILPNALVRGGIVTSLGSGSYGTVTSVGLTAPAAGITVSGSPVTGSGSITLSLADDLAALEAMAGTGIVARTASNTYSQRTITGTANKIDVADGSGVSGNPTVTISATYVGQTSITTLGTIATGTWDEGTW